MDIEAIGLAEYRSFWKGRFSRRHNCVRKISIEFYDDDVVTFEFRPCLDWRDLDDKERQSFRHCKNTIHHLPFLPRNAPNCTDAVKIIGEMLKEKRIDLILHKGGTFEMDLADKLEIDFRNLEDFGVRKFEGVHDPATEVKFFRREFQKIVESMQRDVAHV